MFENCEKLEVVEIPTTLENIKNYAFSGCKALKIINLPEGLKTIESEAFKDCKSLEDIVLPKGVILGNEVFSKCSNKLLNKIKRQDAFKAQNEAVRKSLGGSFYTKYGLYMFIAVLVLVHFFGYAFFIILIAYFFFADTIDEVLDGFKKKLWK